MIEIKNKIIKNELVEWKKFLFIQKDNLKRFKPETFEKLKESIIENNFIQEFKVWQQGEQIYCLDGYHRIKALEEIERLGHRGKFYKIPAKFPASFIDCKDRAEASRLVLVFSSQYAKIHQAGLEEFISLNHLDLSVIENQVEIPNIKLDNLKIGNGEKIEALEERLQPYKKTHILISFEPGRLRFLKPLLEQIQQIEGIEIEQSSN